MTAPRIFIPTKNRHKTMSTAKLFSGYDYYVLVHNAEQAQLYKEFKSLTGVNPKRILVTNVPGDQFGLTRQREWALNNVVDKDEWFVFADDNIKKLEAVEHPQWMAEKLPVQTDDSLRAVFEAECSVERFLNDIFTECTTYADTLGVSHMGFASVDNYFFRGNKWKPVSYIIGKLMLWKNTQKLKFDHSITMEDFELTAQSILQFGYSLVNAYVYPVAGHYEPGGMGMKKERLPDRMNDVKLLDKKYPGLFNVKTRSDGNPDLSLRFHSHEQAETWRKSFKARISIKDLWA